MSCTIRSRGGETMENYNPEEWYTPADAKERLKQNSGGKNIPESYIRSLVRKGVVKTLKLGPRYNLYWKATIDNYIVEDRGQKAARAKKDKAKSK